MCWTAITAAATGSLVLALATCSVSHPGGGAAVTPSPSAAPQAEAGQVFAILEQSAVRLSGQATVGSWSSVSNQVQGEMLPDVQPAAIHAWFDHWEQALRQGAADEAHDITLPAEASPVVQFRVPVDSLKSGNTAMESDMRSALKAEEHPLIEYRLLTVRDVELTPPQDDRAAGPVVRLTTLGELTLAGEQREIEMVVVAHRLADGRFSLVGSRELKMTDFNITPPSALFGLIKARDTVEVVFDLVIGERSQP